MKLATLLMIHTAVVVQPTMTISWQIPTNSVLSITNVAVYSGTQVEKQGLIKNVGLTNMTVVPITTGQNQFWWIRTQNTLGQLSN